MKLGICAKPERLAYVKTLGYDYAEFGLSSTAKWSDEELDAAIGATARAGLRAEVFNGFCPSELSLSHDVDLHAIRDYCEMALPKAERLGAEIIVVGSGRSRRVPDGYDFNAAKDGFKRALCTAADVASRHGMKIAIEPLNRDETNLANTLAEAAELCEAIGRADVGCIVDLFHFYKNGEDMADIAKYSEHILHAHIARRNDDRRIPAMADKADLTDFLDALQSAKLCKRMSLEGKFHPDFESAAKEFFELWMSVTKK